MPIAFNEPLSFLQRITEYMEHTYLLNKACLLPDSIARMQVRHTHTHTRVFYMTSFIIHVCNKLHTVHVITNRHATHTNCLKSFSLGSSCFCCFSSRVSVGQNWKTFQPSAWGDLWTYQVHSVHKYTCIWGHMVKLWMYYPSCLLPSTERNKVSGWYQSRCPIIPRSVPSTQRAWLGISSSMGPSTLNSNSGVRVLRRNLKEPSH